MVKVLVTGATGFIGRKVIKELSDSFELKALVRKSSKKLPLNVEQLDIGDFSDLKPSHCGNALKRAFKNVEVVVHAAARVHIMNEDTLHPLDQFRKVNRDATLLLARLAVETGVKRFIFLSTVKVNGETTKPSKPFTPEDINVPNDPYALSKFEAEQGLLALAKEKNMEIVIIRPPLVYGPGVKGNFSSLMRWMAMPIPLPFGAIHNQRSLVALDNLVSFINLCVNREKSSKASNQIFLISDGQDISTTNLLKKVRQTHKHRSNSRITAWLVPVPVFLLMFIGRIIRKGELIDRLFKSLQVDITKTQQLLGWRPKVTIDEQLAKMK